MTDTSSAHRSRVRIEPSPKWVRAYLGGIAVADSTRAQLVWEIPYYPTYYFPAEDVRTDLLVATGETKRSPSRGDGQLYDIKAGDRVAARAAVRHLDSPVEELRDLVSFDWNALDHWFEENEEVRVHARSPYTRVDTLASDRHVQVLVDGESVADSTHATLLFETGLPTRYYLPREDIVAPIEESETHTTCPFKGQASYYTVGGHKDVAWYYPDPIPEVEPIRGLVAFWSERVSLLDDAE